MKDNNISVRDYTHLNGIESPNLLTPETMEKTIVDNFEKGKITEELFLGGMNVLEKGKRGQIGEIREWSGKRYQKGANGWTPVKEGGAAGKSDNSEKKETKVGENLSDQDVKGRFEFLGNGSKKGEPDNVYKDKHTGKFYQLYNHAEGGKVVDRELSKESAEKVASPASKAEKRNAEKGGTERHTPTQEKREQFEAAQKKYNSLTSNEESNSFNKEYDKLEKEVREIRVKRRELSDSGKYDEAQNSIPQDFKQKEKLLVELSELKQKWNNRNYVYYASKNQLGSNIPLEDGVVEWAKKRVKEIDSEKKRVK